MTQTQTGGNKWLHMTDIIKQLPPRLLRRGKALLIFIKDRNALKWNKNGEIKNANEKTISRSNIITLIKHAISQKNEKKPIGYKTFYALLANSNIPQYLIKNNIGKSVIQNYDFTWRPPGVLASNKKRKPLSWLSTT